MKLHELYVLAALTTITACSANKPAEDGETGGTGGTDTGETATCEVPASIPHDVGANPGQSDFDAFSWQSFLAVNGAQVDGTDTPAWATWSTTADYLNLVSAWSAAGGDASSFPAFGAVYYPQACLDYCTDQGIDCDSYRTLEQVGKVNDSIFEANATGLSADPVIAANGSFLRFEIRMNEDMYELVSNEALYDVNNVVTADVNATCGADGDAQGVMNVKLAWMDIDGFTAADFYTEERLVFTPAGSSSTGADSCELVEMGLVGMHIAHKTLSQQNWVWSTFEHNLNAPDCDTWTNSGVNTACPSTVDSTWNFYPSTCQADGDAGTCQSCNVVPAANDTADPTTCAQGFCVDQAPAAASGYSRLCRQVPVTADGPYSSAYTWNDACQATLGTSVWANYMLISTQWFDWSGDGAPTQPESCSDVAATMDSIPQGSTAAAVRAFYGPQVADNGKGSDKPILGNTSMESYERSNCMGCHGKGALTNSNYVDGSGMLPPQGNTDGTPTTPTSDYYFTDFTWWLALEVPVDGV